MRYLKYILLIIVILSLSKERQCFAQKFADKKYYLVDSLDLGALPESDKHLIDSCLKVYHKAKHDTSKINVLADIIESMMHEDWYKFQFYQHQLIETALKNTSSKKELKRLKKSSAGSLNNIGYFYQDQGKVKDALVYFERSLKLYERIDDREGVAGSLNNMGSVYQGQGQLKEALDYFLRSLKINEEIDNKSGLSTTFNNIGNIYSDQGEIEKALDYFKRGLIINEEVGEKYGIANSLSSIGYIYLQQRKLKEALDFQSRSFKIQEEIGSIEGATYSLINISEIYQKQGQIKKALKSGESSLTMAKKIGYARLVKRAAKSLSVIYEKQGNSLKALETYKLFIQMRDSLNNDQTQKAAVQQQAKYEYEKQKAIDDAEHEKQIAIEQEAKEKQQIITYATGGGLGLVGIFLIFVFNRLQVTKKQKIVIETQKVEVEQQKEEVELAHHELEEKNQEILDSITYAKRIQNAILPPLKVVKEYLSESFILYKPKDIVAGDFYWMEIISFRHSALEEPVLSKTEVESPNEQIAGQARNDGSIVLFAAADCTGHGVPGAMVSVVCNNGLNRSVREFGLTDPGEILNKTREIVIAEFEKSEDEVKDGMDIALCSLDGNTLKYAGANNPLWIIRKQEARDEKEEDNNQQLPTSNYQLIEIKANKQPIGQFDNPEPYTTHTIKLQQGDSIYIFSDGYVDQFGGEKGKKFKAAAFRTLLLSIQDMPMEEQNAIIINTFENWKGNLEQIDDVCIIGVKI